MDVVQFSQATLIIYLLIAMVAIWLQARGFPGGWRVWLLSVVARSYLRCCFHWRENRPCPIPREGPAIVIANHSSPLDPMLLWAGRRRVIGFMMAREFYEVKIINWISRRMQSIPVDRNGEDIKPTREALRRLKAGHLLGIFPEGGINREKRLLPGNTGVAWLALRSKVPVYPVYLCNTPGGKTMVEPFFNFTRAETRFGDQIDLSQYYGQPRSQELLNEVTDYLMAHIAALGNVDYCRIEDGEASADSVENSSASSPARSNIPEQNAL